MLPESTVFPIFLDKLFRNPDDLFKFSTKACETRELWFEGLGLPGKRRVNRFLTENYQWTDLNDRQWLSSWSALTDFCRKIRMVFLWRSLVRDLNVKMRSKLLFRWIVQFWARSINVTLTLTITFASRIFSAFPVRANFSSDSCLIYI